MYCGGTCIFSECGSGSYRGCNRDSDNVSDSDSDIDSDIVSGSDSYSGSGSGSESDNGIVHTFVVGSNLNDDFLRCVHEGVRCV